MSDAPTKGELRKLLKEFSEERVPQILDTFEKMLTAEKTWEPKCERCGHRTRTPLPDWAVRVRVLELLISQGHGRLPSVLPEPPAQDRKHVDLSTLTDEELQALL
jgi:hypothetical protein